ncbi:ATP-binding protein [Streptomyces sp. SID4948]|nr:ATP-binding protein [Streptomyces sp. SID4948]
MSEVYAGKPGAIGSARRLAAAFLDRTRATGLEVPDEAIATAQLVVSELVTNAVKHTGGPCGIDLELAGGIVEITVWDTSTQPVTAADPDPTSVGRHGMEIVAALCGGFHVVRRAVGKQITVRMSLNPVPA